jgi:hypothetical protein
MSSAKRGFALPQKILNLSSINFEDPYECPQHSGKIAPTHFSAILRPRNGRAEKNFIFRKRSGSPARLRWVLIDSKHRRTATRQRGLCGSLLKQLPLDRSQAGIPGKNSSLKIV